MFLNVDKVLYTLRNRFGDILALTSFWIGQQSLTRQPLGVARALVNICASCRYQARKRHKRFQTISFFVQNT